MVYSVNGIGIVFISKEKNSLCVFFPVSANNEIKGGYSTGAASTPPFEFFKAQLFCYLHYLKLKGKKTLYMQTLVSFREPCFRSPTRALPYTLWGLRDSLQILDPLLRHFPLFRNSWVRRWE